MRGAVRALVLTRLSPIVRCALQDKWSAAYSVSTILVSLHSLLGGAHLSCHAPPDLTCRRHRVMFVPAVAEPNNESPLNGYAAQLWDKQEGVLQLALCRAPAGCVTWLRWFSYTEYRRVLHHKYAEAQAAATTTASLESKK